ncbi:MAG: Holliday junction resolvase RuvX [Clostridia bacterium]|nr:Holliday junction resolvase RuvX [Clostridia bacterium]
MVILAVDYGDTRTGIAVCDKTETLASPVCVITEKYQPHLIEKIKAIVIERKAEQIAVGYPLNMDGSAGERAQKCADFAKALQEATGVETVCRDERCTTLYASTLLSQADVWGKKRKAVIDAVAAVEILQQYLDYRRNTNGK